MDAEKQRTWLAPLLYTPVFLFGAGMLILIAKLCGRTLVWNPDGIAQPYTVMTVLRDMLAGNGRSMMSLSIGQGLDKLTTMTFYGYTDPINLIAVALFPAALETGYVFATFLRAYLAGLAFMAWAKKLGARDGGALGLAGVVYVFSGFMVLMFGRHVHFINGPLYLPLMLWGIECVLHDRKWPGYVLVTALMLIVNFYFAYINTVAAVVYIVFRLLCRLPSHGVRESAKDGFMLLGGYLPGAALSGVVFVPVVCLFLKNSRLSVQAGYAGNMLHYPLRKCLNIPVDMFAPMLKSADVLGTTFVPLALFCIPALIGVKHRRAWVARIGVVLCVAAMCVPMVGKVMNGMGYVSPRWTYVTSAFMALCVAFALPVLLDEQHRRTRVVCAVIGFAYAVAAAATGVYRRHWGHIAAAAFIVPMSLLLLNYGKKPKLTRAKLFAVLSILTAFSCAPMICSLYLPVGDDFINKQMPVGIEDFVHSMTPGDAVLTQSGRVAQDAYVYTGKLEGVPLNAPVGNVRTTTYYWSLIDDRMAEYYRTLWIPGQMMLYNVASLGASAPMNAVAAVDRFVLNKYGVEAVPYGFEPVDALSTDEYTVYENTFALPIGYACERRLSVSAYDALPVEQKLQALTHYAICDAQGAEDRAELAEILDIPLQIAPGEGVTLQDHAIEGVKGGVVNLTFDAPEDAEVYLLIEGLRCLDPEDGGAHKIYIGSDAGKAAVRINGPRYNYTFDRPGIAVCLGQDTNGSAFIEFVTDGAFTYDSLRAVALPLAAYREDMAALQNECLTDVVLSDDRITGNINASGDRVLQIAVPYSTGWSAKVDGEKCDIFPCGGMYMGIEIGVANTQSS